MASSELSLTDDWQFEPLILVLGLTFLKEAKFFSMATLPLFGKEGSGTSHMYKNIRDSEYPTPWNQPLGTMGACTYPEPPLYNCKILMLRTKKIVSVVFRQAGLDPHPPPQKFLDPRMGD